ncbi:MAG: LLM class flavin-dependent oxidoreductase [Pirellulales bacterium]
MNFFTFHLMPWDRLPADFADQHASAWTWIPNELFEPEHGGELYNRYLDELLYAEELGFDGVCINEHHQTAYGLMPSPNLMGAILARQTRRVRIAIVGNALPLYTPPTRVAEEYAMIDCISGGRLVAGLVVGGGPEYYSFSINPTHARTMFSEALDLIIRAWTEPGPFEHYGKHWKIRYVNPWPKPVQQPHPPVWIPGAGSLETMQFVARRRYAYMGIPYFHFDVFRRNFAFFQECCQKEGYTASPEQMGLLMPVYVAQSDKQAWEEYEPHLWYFVRNLVKGLTIAPPGYTSHKSMLRIQQALNKFILSCQSRADIEAGTYAIVGSPATVRDKLGAAIKELGVGNVLLLLQLGSLPAELTRKNMNLFAREVLPALRKETVRV